MQAIQGKLQCLKVGEGREGKGREAGRRGALDCIKALGGSHGHALQAFFLGGRLSARLW